MSQNLNDPDTLADLHDSIWREKVLRARKMTLGERCSDVFELSDFHYQSHLAGTLQRLGSSDISEGWKEVGRGPTIRVILMLWEGVTKERIEILDALPDF